MPAQSPLSQNKPSVLRIWLLYQRIPCTALQRGAHSPGKPSLPSFRIRKAAFILAILSMKDLAHFGPRRYNIQKQTSAG